MYNNVHAFSVIEPNFTDCIYILGIILLFYPI